jgi:uncharacterized protein YqeY
MSLRERLNDDLKTAMRARDLDRVGIYRLIFSEIKQKEVDSRTTLAESDILLVLEKMIKQRKDSVMQFSQASRHDLVAKEQIELELILSYLPTPFTDAEIQELIQTVVATLTAENGAPVKSAMMGTIIAAIRPQLAGKADMAKVSAMVKKYLN